MQSTPQVQYLAVNSGGQPPMSTPWVVVPVQPSTGPNHQRRQFVGLGVTLIVVGVLSIIFNSVDLGVGCILFGFVGHGFWCGIMCVIAGSYCVASGVSRTICKIRASLVLCIIAASFCAVQFAMGVVSAIFGGIISYDDECQTAGAAMEALLAAMAIIGAIAAIWASALGCRTVCSNNLLTDQFTIVQNGGMQMTVMSAQQQDGQMVPVLYPTSYAMNYPPNYPVGAGYVPPGYQFPAAPPYYPPPSTAVTSPKPPAYNTQPLVS